MKKRSNVDKAFEAYCQMTGGERMEFEKLCQGYVRGVSGPPKPKVVKKRVATEPPTTAA